MKLFIFIAGLLVNPGTHRLLRDLVSPAPLPIDVTLDDESILKQLRYKHIHNSGIDEHFNTLEEKILYSIIRNCILVNILRNLENPDLSELNKLEYLSTYDDFIDSSKYTHELIKGGLFDDWDFEL